MYNLTMQFRTTPRHILIPFLFLAITLAALCAPSTVFANAVLEDWRDNGTINGNYSISELKNARQSVSPEELEYTDLSTAIDAAIRRKLREDARAASDKGTASGSKGGPTGTGGKVAGKGVHGDDDEPGSPVAGVTTGDDDGPTGGGDPDETQLLDDNDPASAPGEGGISWPALAVVIGLLGITGVSGWRWWRGRP